MPPRGRPRLSEDDLRARSKAYCTRYGVSSTKEALPPFPAGKRETPQHREWIALYKLHSRIGRRSRGQCERCPQPSAEGSIFCEQHRADAAARAGDSKASLDEGRALLAAQDGKCPVCAGMLELRDAVVRSPSEGVRALLHAPCERLAGLAEPLGPDALDRLRRYLWPRALKPRR